MHLGELMRDMDIDDEIERRERREDTLVWLEFLAAVVAGAPGGWAEAAACKGQTAVMFPERGESAEPARALCAGCAVVDECRSWAATVPGSQSGIIGGTSGAQRRVMRAERLAAAA